MLTGIRCLAGSLAHLEYADVRVDLFIGCYLLLASVQLPLSVLSQHLDIVVVPDRCCSEA